MDDFPLGGATVLLRLDINSPINPVDGTFLDDTRVQAHLQTLRELAGSKVVVLAHQSRPGKADFTTMREHARNISVLLRRPTKYVDDLFGSTAVARIRAMADGEVIVLENTRFYSEEEALAGKSIDAQANSHIVRKLTPEADYFINDAYAASHRDQPTLVGFTRTMPSMAGRLMEREVQAVARSLNPSERPAVAVLGGAKVDDSIDVMEHMLARKAIDAVLTGGVVANIALLASGVDVGQGSRAFIERELPDWKGLVERTRKAMQAHPGVVRVPHDVVVNEGGQRVGIKVDALPNANPIFDIGLDTMTEYRHMLAMAKVIVANGPMGVFEVEQFAVGTRGIMDAIADSSAYKVIGGGHTAALVTQLGMADRVDHVSTGGGALIQHLSGKPMPVIEALKESKRLHLEGKIAHRRA
jgi:phosphoglycerate kinase